MLAESFFMTTMLKSDNNDGAKMDKMIVHEYKNAVANYVLDE